MRFNAVMTMCRIVSAAAFAALAFGGSIAAAVAQIAPIVIREAKDHPGCQIYLKADGSRLLYQGAPVTPSGRCPSEFKQGTVTRFGAATYKMTVDGKTCVMTPQGAGRCQ